MRRALAFACLLATLGGCTGHLPPQPALPVHDERIEAQADSQFCYQLIVCPLVSAAHFGE